MASKVKKPEVTRVTLNLRADAYKKVSAHAIVRGETFTASLNRLLDLALFMKDKVDEGSKVLIKGKDGKFAEVIFYT